MYGMPCREGGEQGSAPPVCGPKHARGATRVWFLRIPGVTETPKRPLTTGQVINHQRRTYVYIRT